jgi:hypothetical protein
MKRKFKEFTLVMEQQDLRITSIILILNGEFILFTEDGNGKTENDQPFFTIYKR